MGKTESCSFNFAELTRPECSVISLSHVPHEYPRHSDTVSALNRLNLAA